MDGFYDGNCSSKCGACVNDEVCEKSNGHCSNGCKAHFQLPLCQGIQQNYSYMRTMVSQKLHVLIFHLMFIDMTLSYILYFVCAKPIHVGYYDHTVISSILSTLFFFFCNLFIFKNVRLFT